MTMKRAISITFCTFFIALLAVAQGDAVAEAATKYREGDLRGAQSLLDGAAKDPAMATSVEMWVLRGFVYKDLYKTAPAGQADILRDEAMASLYTAIGLDKNRQYAESSEAAYRFLAKTIYNDAVHAMNTLNADRAIGLYGKYQGALRRLDPDRPTTDSDIEFNNALGTVYVKLFTRDRGQNRWYEKAIDVYKHVLVLDSNNYGANYNLATLYYNRGVYNIQQISADNDIPSLQQIQEASRGFFTLALPYMLKAHRMKPDRPETILGLEGIHYSLQDERQSKYYRHLYEELKHDEKKGKDQ